MLAALRGRSPRAGTLFTAWPALHALARFGLGFVRLEPVITFGLQPSQWSAVVPLVGLTSGIIRQRCRAARCAGRPT